MYDFGLRIKELREQHGLSQEELGRRIGRSKPVISSYENNIKTPPLDILVKIAITFNVSLDYLVGIEKNRMVSVSSLSPSQERLIQMIIQNFKNPPLSHDGLSSSQLEIIKNLVYEFSKTKY